jgi:hypothetical protein
MSRLIVPIEDGNRPKPLAIEFELNSKRVKEVKEPREEGNEVAKELLERTRAAN